MTLLMWTARYGREEVVKFLLQQKHTLPDMADTIYGTLLLAAHSGHEGEPVVRVFLGPLVVNPGNRSLAGNGTGNGSPTGMRLGLQHK